ncbi:hypothetical protein ES708_11598 [subsurface metagenome]
MMVTKSRWTVEQLESLRDMEVHFPDGHLCLFPIILGFGKNIKWDARIYIKGAAGVLPVDKVSLLSIGASDADADVWVARTARALSALRGLYPSLVPALEARIKELAEAAPALPAGEPARVSD